MPTLRNRKKTNAVSSVSVGVKRTRSINKKGNNKSKGVNEGAYGTTRGITKKKKHS